MAGNADVAAILREISDVRQSTKALANEVTSRKFSARQIPLV